MRDIRDRLVRLNDHFSTTIDRFQRRMASAATRQAGTRAAAPPTPSLPSTRAHRPTPHRLALPVRYRRGKPPTALDRVRQAEERRNGGPNEFVASVRRGASRVRGSIRSGLRTLHDKLARLRANATRSRSGR